MKMRKEFVKWFIGKFSIYRGDEEKIEDVFSAQSYSECWEAALQEQNNTAVALLKEASVELRQTWHDYRYCVKLADSLDAVLAQSLPQAITTGSTSTVRVCEKEGIIKCPNCGEKWDTNKHNACQCGAVCSDSPAS